MLIKLQETNTTTYKTASGFICWSGCNGIYPNQVSRLAGKKHVRMASITLEGLDACHRSATSAGRRRETQDDTRPIESANHAIAKQETPARGTDTKRWQRAVSSSIATSWT